MHNEPPKDHVEGEGGYEDEPAPKRRDFDSDSGSDSNSDSYADPEPRRSIDENLRNRATWQRFLFMIIMAVLFCLGITVSCIVVLLQFFWVLFTGETKREFLTVGRQLAEYSREVVLYMTFVTDERPFPFDRPWPSDESA